MKKLWILFTVTSVLLLGCSQEKSYNVWVDSSTQSQEMVDSSTQSQEMIDSAIERLTDAEVDFIIDENGSVLVNEKDMNKVLMCCT
ncbi:hypothetical protein ABNX05_00255 [Lysinibacillus sp. M3]|uniref:Uncharacterized protein n=1 Tax=Lysinibacillus zambalensis TaxID=3160866 RepID=A0ABV1MKL5_9BACI